MSALRVYVAGPVHGSGEKTTNMRNAMQAGQMLAKAGFVPYIPHLFLMMDIMFGLDEHMRLDHCRSWLAACDLLVRLPGESPGSDMEVALARSLGIPVFERDGEIGDYLTPVRLLIQRTKGWMGRNHEQEQRENSRVVVLDSDDSEYNPNYAEFSHFQAAVDEWLSRQPFGTQEKYESLLGVTEELGELCHAHLKNVQKIRGFEDEVKTKDAKQDAIGDMMVYLAGYCRSNNLDLGECIKRAWEEVRLRDWNKNGANGKVDAPMAGVFAPLTKPLLTGSPDGPGDGAEVTPTYDRRFDIHFFQEGAINGVPTQGCMWCGAPREVHPSKFAGTPQRMTGADRMQPSPYSDHRPSVFRGGDGDND